MIDFLSQNLGSIIILLAVIAFVGFLIFRIVRNRRTGGSSCSCGCSDCPMSKSCQGKQQN